MGGGTEYDVLTGNPGSIFKPDEDAFEKFSKNYDKKKDEKWYQKKHTARFICSLTIYWPNNKFVTSTGIIEGTISKFKKVIMVLDMTLYLYL